MITNWTPDICIFHCVVPGFACPDGLAAAWVVKQKYSQLNSNLKFVGLAYADVCTELFYSDAEYCNKNIVIVDFSLPNDILDCLHNQGCTYKIIDHHKGFLAKALSPSIYEQLTRNKSALDNIQYYTPNIFFDNSECGATLAWKLLFKDLPIPKFLSYIKQNDLFEFKDSDAEAVHFGMAKLGRTFNLFDRLYAEELAGDWEFAKYNLTQLGHKTIATQKEKFKKIIANPKKYRIHNNIPVVTLNKSEMSLKSRIAKFIYESYDFPFCCVLDTARTRLRLKGKGYGILEVLSDYGAVGHSSACSLDTIKFDDDSINEFIDVLKQRLDV